MALAEREAPALRAHERGTPEHHHEYCNFVCWEAGYAAALHAVEAEFGQAGPFRYAGDVANWLRKEMNNANN